MPHSPDKTAKFSLQKAYVRRLLNHVKKILVLVSVLFSGCSAFHQTGTGFGERKDVKAFIHKVSLRDHFTPQSLTVLFNQVKPRVVVIHHTDHPRETTVSWQRYRAIFLTPLKIKKGVKFWQDHVASLNLAQQQYGVDPAIIVGIIGIETEYGAYLGKFRVLDSLSTLAFDYPQRQKFFQHELEQYLLLTRELRTDPLKLYGSYAGALGLPQFMPSNYRQLAVSSTPAFPDLYHNANDAILSVANYLQHHYWQPDQPVAKKLKYAKKSYKSYKNTRTQINQLEQFDQEYWQLYPNFKVIKSYNNSDFYAMAVYQFSETVKHEYTIQK